ncbi:MAG: formyltransferase family protein [Acidobacteriota bacterium]
MPERHYVVAAHRPWNRRVFDRELSGLPGRWSYVDTPDELTAAALEALQPDRVFFLHWSWIVPEKILERWECVGFHMTDLPYGRGGSPLQNLLLRGHEETVLTAFRLTRELDAGPVYLKRPLNLAGSAEEIYVRASRTAAGMIAEILRSDPEPQPQQGKATTFARRSPKESRLPEDLTELRQVHDFVRMLDAEGYPRAFIKHGRFRLELSRSVLYDSRVVADVTITEDPLEEG